MRYLPSSSDRTDFNLKSKDFLIRMATPRLWLEQRTKGMLFGMFFGTKQKLANAFFKIQLHGSDIDRVRNFCCLGVVLDECLSSKEHVSKVCTEVNKRLGLLGRIRSCLTLKAAKCVYNCLVLPVLCYTDTAWGELSVEYKSRLQRLQNRAAHIIVRRDSSSEALKTLGWPNLETIRKRNKSILV